MSWKMDVPVGRGWIRRYHTDGPPEYFHIDGPVGLVIQRMTNGWELRQYNPMADEPTWAVIGGPYRLLKAARVAYVLRVNK